MRSQFLMRLVIITGGCIKSADLQSVAGLNADVTDMSTQHEQLCDGRLLDDGRCIPSNLAYCEEGSIDPSTTPPQITFWCLPPYQTELRALPQIQGELQPNGEWLFRVPDSVVAPFVAVAYNPVNQVIRDVYVE